LHAFSIPFERALNEEAKCTHSLLCALRDEAFIHSTSYKSSSVPREEKFSRTFTLNVEKKLKEIFLSFLCVAAEATALMQENCGVTTTHSAPPRERKRESYRRCYRRKCLKREKSAKEKEREKRRTGGVEALLRKLL
jgi:hypothetical protein